MAQVVELPLEKVLFHRGRILRSLKLRAPTQEEVDLACAFSGDPDERSLFLIPLITGVPPRTLARLGAADMARLGEQFDALVEA